jgi:hypothetical protein
MTIRKFLPVTFVFLCYVSFAQDTQSNLDSVSSQLVSNIRLQQTEQSFIVTDRSLYKTGESVWLRVFLLRSASQKLSRVSKNLFIELVNEKDSVFSTLLLDVKTGMLNAKLYLGQSMPSGFYWIRAYTRYMADVETNKIAVSPIYVVNNAALNDNGSRLVQRGNYSPDNISMQLFPEGGFLMTGANSTMAFHIVDGKKDPVAISGYVKDDRDSVVTSFTSDNYGLGKFEFFPTRGRRYKAQLIWNGKEMTFSLPPFNFFAGQLSVVNDNNGQRKIRVLLEDSVYKQNIKTYLVGIAKDSLCFASVGTGMYEVPIPAEKFPGGITTFYLFGENLHLLSERSVYFKDNLIIKANLNKTVYKKREKADLSISVTDAQGHSLPASLSIAVVDSNLIRPANTLNVVSDYFENNDELSSNNWLLANANDLTDEQLDLLMMARNNSYRDIMFRTNRPTFYSDSDSLLYIQGKAFYSKEKPAANKIATIFSKTAGVAYDIDTTSNAGRFVFPLVEYPDSTRFLIQVSNPQGTVEHPDIVLDKFNFPKVKMGLPKEKFTVRPATVNHYLKVYPDSLFGIRGDELSGVTVKGYKKKELSYDASKRVSPDSKIITSDDIGKGTNSVSNAFLRVPGVQIVNGYVVIKGISSFAPGASTEPMVFLDGIRASLGGGGMSSSPVLNYLDMLNPDDVSFIEVLTGPEGSVYGVRGGNGVVLINSKKMIDEPKSNGPNSFLVRGYHTPPAFMMPDYSISKIKAGKFNDIRSTLYWDPSSLTDENGRIDIAFFTSDVTTNYKVIITGITAHGDVINRTISFRTE